MSLNCTLYPKTKCTFIASDYFCPSIPCKITVGCHLAMQAKQVKSALSSLKGKEVGGTVEQMGFDICDSSWFMFRVLT